MFPSGKCNQLKKFVYKQASENLVYMYKFQPKNFAFYREAALRGTDKKVNISEIAKQTRVPVPTLWKCVRDKV